VTDSISDVEGFIKARKSPEYFNNYHKPLCFNLGQGGETENFTMDINDMKEYLKAAAVGYAHMETAEIFAEHILRNYSPEQQSTFGSNIIEQAYNLLRSRTENQ
jgi:hypothetical protein